MGRGELGADGTPCRRPGDIKTSERKREVRSEEKERRSEEGSVGREKAKGERKKQRPREATKKRVSNHLQRDNLPFQCFIKRACGARVGVSSATNK